LKFCFILEPLITLAKLISFLLRPLSSPNVIAKQQNVSQQHDALDAIGPSWKLRYDLPA
jgi:hypothetical protein